ncbi:hypothetical protein BP6252_12953 [Coleophoma cylindrospora]|uniref:Uncharacterized protein n=1 Tax=Coleophoma cylindrospora TaxID=1849047 RepID=A0A3D8QDD3_9HELO|nr:hypothetical protein BP6252_12953 [Coleophoma cylindrospora]
MSRGLRNVTCTSKACNATQPTDSSAGHHLLQADRYSLTLTRQYPRNTIVSASEAWPAPRTRSKPRASIRYQIPHSLTDWLLSSSTKRPRAWPRRCAKSRKGRSHPGLAAKGKGPADPNSTDGSTPRTKPAFPTISPETEAGVPEPSNPQRTHIPSSSSRPHREQSWRGTAVPPKPPTKLRSSPKFSCFWLAPSSFVLQPVMPPALFAASPLPGPDETRGRLEFGARADAAQSVEAFFRGCLCMLWARWEWLAGGHWECALVVFAPPLAGLWRHLVSVWPWGIWLGVDAAEECVSWAREWCRGVVRQGDTKRAIGSWAESR